MLTYPNIDPVAVAVGPFEVHWYGLMYLIAFVTGWWLGYIRTRRVGTQWKAAEISDLLFYFALGAILGGRIGYTLMYNFSGFLDDPVVIFRIWQGGMSYHGGMVGVFVAMWLYGRHTGRTFFQVTDYLAPLVPLGLGAGRMGNFINGELWGSPTDLPWGMVFPRDPLGLARRGRAVEFEAQPEQVGDASRLQLLHHPRPVGLHGFCADPKTGGDLFVRLSVGNHLHHLKLTWS